MGLVSPLVSALHIHAVAETREGRTPRLGPVARRGVVALPAVAAASIISTLGVAVGFVALIVPGIYLLLRWAVVAQAAAVEREGWMSALSNSYRLTESHYGHVILFVLLVSLIAWTPILVLDLGLEGSTNAASFVVGLVVQIFALSFTALATALLYYDLRARLEPSQAPERAPGPGMGGGSPARTDPTWDPRAFSDQDRPKGWYVDPASPTRMRYWCAGDEPGWVGTTSTPPPGQAGLDEGTSARAVISA